MPFIIGLSALLDIGISLVIVVVMLLYVPYKRTTAASRTWLLLIFFQPIVGLLLYLAFGRIYVSKRRLALQARSAQVIAEAHQRFHTDLHHTRPTLRPAVQHVAQMAEELGDFTVVGGNTFELLSDYDDSIDRLVHDIDEAEHSANLLYYIFADDQTGGKVAEALVRAAQRGVTCRVLMDGIGSRPALKTLAPRLRAAGVEVHELLKPGVWRRGIARYDLRNHRKIVVIDQRVGYIGSQNLVKKDFKKGIAYEELVARVSGPVLLQLQAVFFTDRFLETELIPTPETEPHLFTFPAVTGTSAAQTLPSGPGYHQGTTGRLLVGLLYAASERVVLTTPYFVPDEAIFQALLTTAQRGVQVHLVVSRAADQLLVSLAQKSYYGDLLEAGVTIHLYRPPHFMHAKHMTFDDAVAIIGSSNIDVRSLELNAESSVLIYDPTVVADLRRVQERYFAQSDMLTAGEWSQRSMHHKLAQNTARLFDSFL
ncbi:MAG TPA: cardiolipin synthase [Ktedonobacterales bacterium]|nr:cardiolipin synthase [Ktedonobacterales bacterium]